MTWNVKKKFLLNHLILIIGIFKFFDKNNNFTGKSAVWLSQTISFERIPGWVVWANQNPAWLKTNQKSGYLVIKIGAQSVLAQ